MDIRYVACVCVTLFVVGCQSKFLAHKRGAEAEEGAVRLMNGDAPNAGRVEIFHNGKWGTVCDDWWTSSAARVVCKQLGFNKGRGRPVAVPKGKFGPGEGPIWLDAIDCLGIEKHLGECEHDPWGQTDCSHREDAGVICNV